MGKGAQSASNNESNKQNLDFKLIVWFFFVTILAVVIRYILYPFAISDINSNLNSVILSLQNDGKINLETVKLLDVNFSYIYLSSTLTFFTQKALLSIKFINTIFDFLLAIGVWAIVKNYTGNKVKAIIAYSVSLFLPSVLLISGMWGKSETVVAALLVWMIYSVLKNRIVTAVLFFSLAFSIKWWAIFLLPLLVIYLLAKKRSLIFTLVLIPAFLLMFSLPAMLQGNSVSSVLLIYLQQGETITTINSTLPTLNTLLKSGIGQNLKIDAINGSEQTLLFTMIDRLTALLAVFVVSIFSWLAWVFKPDWNWVQTIRFSLFSSLIMPFFLPKISSTYFFMATVLALIYAFLVPKKFWYLIAIEFISLLLVIKDFLTQSMFVDKSLILILLSVLIVFISLEMVSEFESFKTLRQKVAMLSSKYLAKKS